MQRTRKPSTDSAQTDSGSATHSSGRRLSSTESAGLPLNRATLMEMGGAFGHDFGTVRVHDDARAAEQAEVLHAKAFTVGEDIYFKTGAYAPGTPEGDRLVAHELAHVAQNRHADAGSESFRVSEAGDPGELNADHASEIALSGHDASAAVEPASNAGIQREGEEGHPWWQTALSTVGLGHSIGEAGHAAHTIADFTGKTLGFGPSTDAFALTEHAAHAGGAAPLNFLAPLALGNGLHEMYENTIGNEGHFGLENIGNTLAGAAETVSGGIGSLGLAGAGLSGLGATGVGGALSSAAAASAPVAAVAGAGAAGYGVGRLLDRGADWVGDKITGNEAGDHSLSGMSADAMTSVDQGFAGLMRSAGVYDSSKPEYTQTLGWQLAEILPSWLQ